MNPEKVSVVQNWATPESVKRVQWFLGYAQTAKRRNLWQARWALFFTHLSFLLTYPPGSKNTKPNALSRVSDRSNDDRPPEPVIPAGWIVTKD